MAPPMRMRALLLLLLLALTAANVYADNSESPIKNVVILALENHSFDHMLGWMRRLLGLPIDGLTGAECNVDPTNSSLPPVCVTADAPLVVPDDPGHSFEDVLDQVFGSRPNGTAGAADLPTMSGFVRSALSVNTLLSSEVMPGFTPSLLTAFSALAADFAVFDRWFSYLPGLFDSLAADGLPFAVYFKTIPTVLFYRRLRTVRNVASIQMKG